LQISGKQAAGQNMIPRGEIPQIRLKLTFHFYTMRADRRPGKVKWQAERRSAGAAKS
jgi:hypothetical protein